MVDQPDHYRFDEITMAGGGRIGLGCCPGHRLTPWMVRAQPGSLADDLSLIADWRPDLVLTLMESHELDFVGAPARLIGEHFARAGRRWVHLPIRNLREPDERFEIAWPGLFADIDTALGSGGRLFIHCYAGLGRTGTVAARLFMEREGVGAAEAIAMIRAARPGSIETREQERYLFGLRGPPEG